MARRWLYFDNAANSWPKAPGMAECMAEAAFSMPGHSTAGLGGEDPLSLCRRLLAEHLQLKDPNRIIFTQSATYALNMALLGFPWKAEDVVLTTAAEHNSLLRPLYALKQKGAIKGFVVLPVGSDGRVTPDFLEKCIRELKPRMFAFTHASNMTGAVNDAASIAAICRKRHVTSLMDASQTIGMLPVLPEKWGVDIIAAAGHKYLLSFTGTGFLYVAGGVDIMPVFTGEAGAYADRWTMPDELPSRLEAGAVNESGLCSLANSLRYLHKEPPDLRNIIENIMLLEQGISACGASPLRVEGERMPVLSFSCAMTPAELGEILSESYDVICGIGIHCAPLLLRFLELGEEGSVRLSLSRFTTRDEIDELLADLKEILP